MHTDYDLVNVKSPTSFVLTKEQEQILNFAAVGLEKSEQAVISMMFQFAKWATEIHIKDWTIQGVNGDEEVMDEFVL